MRIRGVEVDHATIQRWVFKFMPEIEIQMPKRKKVVGKRWRMDETYIKVKGGTPELINIEIRQCKYLNPKPC
jgi:putative transposase